MSPCRPPRRSWARRCRQRTAREGQALPVDQRALHRDGEHDTQDRQEERPQCHNVSAQVGAARVLCRGTDAQGRQFYSYNDPSVMDAGQGKNNRFYVDPGSGNLVHEGAMGTGYVRDRHTELSMVIRS